MKNFVFGIVLLAVGGVVSAAERSVIVPTDDKPFEVEKLDIVRLTGKGIAGSKIEIKIDGPAKVQNINTVSERTAGRNRIGALIKEFELQATGTGKVIATITVTPPQPDAKSTKTKFEFEGK